MRDHTGRCITVNITGIVAGCEVGHVIDLAALIAVSCLVSADQAACESACCCILNSSGVAGKQQTAFALAAAGQITDQAACVNRGFAAVIGYGRLVSEPGSVKALVDRRIAACLRALVDVAGNSARAGGLTGDLYLIDKVL